MNRVPSAPTLICGYCGVLQAQREGVAAISTWGSVARGNILTAIRSAQ